MKRWVVCGPEWQKLLGEWIAQENKGDFIPGRSSYIGLLREDGVILAVSEFADWNGASVLMHCASGGKNWLNRDFLWFSFYYPFEQLKVNKIISPVGSDNYPCRRFIEHIGFSLEATLKDCSPAGDTLIYTMSRTACRWLEIRGKHEQAKSPSAA
jgi:hypothetical protein